jgi:hypothetical protein
MMLKMQLKELSVIVIALAIIACSGCLSETRQNEKQDTVQQNSSPFMNLSSGFHDIENWSGTPTRWMQANATLLINSPENRTANLSLNALSFYRNRTLEIYAGNDLLTRATISPEGFSEINAPVHLVTGENILRLHVPEGCERPSDIKELNNTDHRCLSVAIQSIAVDERKSGPLNYLSGFHVVENWSGIPTRWMQPNATLLINSPENYTANLSLNALSFYRNRTLEIATNGAPIAQIAVPTSFINVRVPIHLAKGENTVLLHIPEGCERPSDIKELNNPDSRCLSVAVQNLNVI